MEKTDLKLFLLIFIFLCAFPQTSHSILRMKNSWQVPSEKMRSISTMETTALVSSILPFFVRPDKDLPVTIYLSPHCVGSGKMCFAGCQPVSASNIASEKFAGIN